jgi:hypothetical protein
MFALLFFLLIHLFIRITLIFTFVFVGILLKFIACLDKIVCCEYVKIRS